MIHLRAVPDSAIPSDRPQPCYAVVQRKNGEWTTAATIRSFHPSLDEAEAEAERLKEIQFDVTFGVFALRSEQRPKQKLVETVRVES